MSSPFFLQIKDAEQKPIFQLPVVKVLHNIIESVLTQGSLFLNPYDMDKSIYRTNRICALPLYKYQR